MKITKPLQTNLFFLDSVKFLGHQIQNNHIYLLKSKLDGFHELKPSKYKKEIQNYVGFLTFISKYIYTVYTSSLDLFISNSEIQQILNGLLNYNKHLIESKNNLQTKHSDSKFLIQKNHSIFCAMPLTMALEQHCYKKINLEKRS